MKTKLTIILLLLWAGVVCGQEQKHTATTCNNKKTCKCPKKSESTFSKVITIDPFGNDVYPSDFKLKKGSTVKFQINNVNTFKVLNDNVESKGSNIVFELPKVSEDVAMVFAKKDTVTNAEKKKDKNFIAFLQMKQNVARFIEEYENFTTQANFIEQKVNLGTTIEKMYGDKVFIKDTSSLTKAVKEQKNLAYNDDLEISENIAELKKSHIKLKSLYKDINNKESEAVLSGTVKVDGKPFKVESIKLNASNANFLEEEMNAANKAITSIDDEKKIANLISNAIAGKRIAETASNDKFVYTTKAKQLNDDEVTLIPALKDKDDKEIYKFDSIKIQTYGGWKINFSAGYFLSFISNDNYSTFTNASGDKEVSKGSSDKVTHALGGLLHVYSNRPQWLVQPGFSFGLSLADNSSLGFYAGPSLFFLEKNRLVTTFGYSFLKVKRLNTSNLLTLQEPDKYTFVNTADTEIRYDNVYKGAWFFGVTYNLSK